jgi:hypothetical protein
MEDDGKVSPAFVIPGAISSHIEMTYSSSRVVGSLRRPNRRAAIKRQAQDIKNLILLLIPLHKSSYGSPSHLKNVLGNAKIQENHVFEI